jgi:hypothetical protein
MTARLRLLVLVTLVALLPQIASAHGVPIRGMEIQGTGTTAGSVGKCSCTDQWYTIGLRPGSTTIVATIKGHSGVAAVSYGIRMGVLRVTQRTLQTVGFSQAACLSSQHRCNATARIKLQVRGRGAYYVKVSGLGANGITYAMSIQGHVYRVH